LVGHTFALFFSFIFPQSRFTPPPPLRARLSIFYSFLHSHAITTTMAVRDVATVADLDAALASAPAVSWAREGWSLCAACVLRSFFFSADGNTLALCSLTTIPSIPHIKKKKHKAALNFTTAWSEPGKAMDAVFATLAADFPKAAFLRLDAEADALVAAAERFGVTLAPTFLFLKGGSVAGRVEGADAPALADAAATHLAGCGAAKAPAPAAAPAAPPSSASTTLDPAVRARLTALMASRPVMLFMKGSPDAPRCGFSRRVVAALEGAGIAFGHVDILEDGEARDGLKIINDWPTFPQLIAGGQLVGGCDIVEELAAAGELKAEVEAAAAGAGGA
jgi:Grx4 family monothiol glutaredoxin